MPLPDPAQANGGGLHTAVAPGVAPLDRSWLRSSDCAESGGAPVSFRHDAQLVCPPVIGFGEPFRIALGRRPEPADRWGSFAAGVTLAPVAVDTGGRSSCVQVDFTPAGARMFFGLRLRDLEGRMVSPDDLGDRALCRLRDRLAATACPADRLALTEAFVLQRLAQADLQAPGLEAALRLIAGHGRRLPVAEVAARLGWSRGHLARRSADGVGATPKDASRLARFAAAARIARSRPVPDWAGVAAEAGFADQAHLSREFRAPSGLSPRAWLAERAAAHAS